jgi:hypothetical protein
MYAAIFICLILATIVDLTLFFIMRDREKKEKAKV